MSSNRYVHRCPTCKTKCPKIVEDKMRTPSNCVLVEANKFTRKAARSDLDEKIRVWGNAIPPAHLLGSRYTISLFSLEKAKFLKKGSFNLTEEQETISLKIPDDEANKSSDEDTSSETSSDDYA